VGSFGVPMARDPHAAPRAWPASHRAREVDARQTTSPAMSASVATAGITDDAAGTAATGVRSSSDLRDGAMAMAPLLIGFAPYAIVVGSVIGSHSSPAAGWAGIWLIFAGSAHLATLNALDDGSALLAALTGILVNARLLVYSASLAGRWRHQPRWFRLAAAPFIVDPTWLVSDQRSQRPSTLAAERRFFFGAAFSLAAVWGALATVGMVVGSHAGGGLGLDVAVPLCLFVLVVPRLRDRRGLLVGLTTAAVAVLTASWPAGSGLLVAITAGTFAGWLASRERS
jgi:predicted branched-subunit amino acid permease